VYFIGVWNSFFIFLSIVVINERLFSIFDEFPVRCMLDIQNSISAKYQLHWRCFANCVDCCSQAKSHGPENAAPYVVIVDVVTVCNGEVSDDASYCLMYSFHYSICLWVSFCDSADFDTITRFESSKKYYLRCSYSY